MENPIFFSNWWASLLAPPPPTQKRSSPIKENNPFLVSVKSMKKGFS
jgi:hypothetical protein